MSRNGRYTHFAIVAAREAMKDSGIDLSSPTFDKDRFGCIVGSGIGGVEWFENVKTNLIAMFMNFPFNSLYLRLQNCNDFTAAGGGYNSLRAVNPFLIPALISNTASGVIAIEFEARVRG